MALIVPKRGRVRQKPAGGGGGGVAFEWASNWGYDDAQEIEAAGNTLNGVLANTSTGDMLVLALTFDTGADDTFVWGGITWTTVWDGTMFTAPGNFVGYYKRQAGDTEDPHIDSGVGTTDWRGGSYCIAAFSGVDSYIARSADAYSSTGMPDANSLTPGGSPALYVVTAHMDDDQVTFTAPSGYTLATTRSYSNGGYVTSSAIAYKITTNATEDPGVWGGGSFTDDNNAFVLAFSAS